MSVPFSTILSRLLAPLAGAQGTGAGSRRKGADAFPGGAWGRRACALWLPLIFSLLAFPAPAAVLLPANGTAIENVARIDYFGRFQTARVNFLFAWNTPSRIEFLKYAPGNTSAESVRIAPTDYRTGGSEAAGFAPLAAPHTVGGTAISLADPLPLVAGTLYHAGEPVFIRLTDLDQNIDPAAAETVVVTVTTSAGDREVLRLTETGPDTGIFTGHIQSRSGTAAPYDGALTVALEGTVEARYVDQRDGSDASTAASLFDPFGIVFDSVTGLPVTAVVTLVHADTGEPATVFGDEGHPYPASITTGTTVIDEGGTVHHLGPGQFRFPFVAPGRYRLLVEPGPGYVAPSSATIPELQALPLGPWALGDGSFRLPFDVDPGPALQVDIPVDPISTRLWLEKSAAKDRAAPGDFVPYRLRLQNPDTVRPTHGGIVLTDRLPPGFRYVPGSVRLNDNPTAEPAVSGDGRTLTFTLGDLPPEGTHEIFYVAEVGAGARPGKAVNTAVATLGDIRSNAAEAIVIVGDDFFRRSTFLLGRVHTGGCDDRQFGEPDGLKDVRIYLEDGTYVLTDEDGMFHFEGVRPGVHVVQLDHGSLPDYYEPVACEENTRFAGRADSQFVDLQGGSLWRTDFYLKLKPRPRGEVRVEKKSFVEGEQIVFQLPLTVDAVPLKNLRLAVLLPEKLQYLPGSARLADLPLAEPKVEEGALVFQLGDRPAGWDGQVEFAAAPRSDKDAGDLWTFAYLAFDAPAAPGGRTPAMENVHRQVFATQTNSEKMTVQPHFDTFRTELKEEDRQLLDTLAARLQKVKIHHLFAIGHTDNVRIAPRSQHIFKDNFALAEARARSVAGYLGEKLQLPTERITLAGLGETVPVASNATAAGREQNRRVELQVDSETLADTAQLETVRGDSGPVVAPTVGLHPGEIAREEARQKAEETVGILYPADGTYLAGNIAAVRIRLESRLKPRLFLDGKEIPADRIGFKMEDKETKKTLYSYIGVDFGGPGKHLLKLQGIDPFGNARVNQEATIVRTGEIAAIRLLAEGDNVADGRTPVTFRVEVLDKAGERIKAPVEITIREGNLKPFGYKAAEIPTEKTDAEELKVLVDADGLAKFAPVITSGPYRAVLGYNTAELKLDTYVKPELRDWILVGLAEGTAGYNTISGNMENLPAEVDEDLYHDGRVAFFGKGRVLGKWLLTLAYDSDKPDRKDQELFQTIDPDAYYMLYGDASQQAYEAASAEKIFVKLEREAFYALFGDYTTGLDKTELSRYSRALTGFKSEYQGRYFAVNAFASDTGQNFVKDEIRGDGTSGLYRLSGRQIVLNSETIRIEVRDRIRSEIILSSRGLTRHIDYNIDYAAGTLFFKEPVPSQDENFNPVYIVVDYETDGSGGTSLNYGGRASVRLPQLAIEVGATGIHEEQDRAEGDLWGADAKWEIGRGTVLRAELAASDAEDHSTATPERRQGTAWLTELAHQDGRLAGKLYFRELEEGFGLGQQRASEEGTRKIGADAAWSLSQEWSLAAEIFRQYNLEEDAVRDVAEASTRYKTPDHTLEVGLRQAVDEFADGEKETSTQALIGGTWQATKRLLLRAAHEQSLFGNNESGDFPTRTLLGADFKLTTATTLFAAHEWTRGEDERTDSTRIGFKTTPWTGAQMDSALEQVAGEYGPRMFALFGLKQNLRLSDGWSLDGGLDRSHSIREPDARDFDKDVPPASGSSEDFTAVFLGATYRETDWSWENRVEYRDGETEDKWGIFTSLLGEVRPGLGVSARAQIFLTEAGADGDTTDGEIRLGLGYRPLRTRWIVLDRLEYRFEKEAGGETGFNSWRLINNLNANYKLENRTQVSLQYGAKYVQENIEGQEFGGYTDLTGIEARYDFSRKWDLGLRGSMLHSWDSDRYEFSAGPSLGFQAMENAWVSVGYNVFGFRDEDFSRSEYTAQGPFVKMRLKFDQNSVRDALKSL